VNLTHHFHPLVMRRPDSTPDGAQQFDQALAQGQQGHWWGALRRRARRLGRLGEAARQASANCHSAGLQLVPLSRITGTESRDQRFDAEFNPLSAKTRSRWISVFQAREAGLALPPVELTQVGDHYYVRDGHHRISVARALGQQDIEANVTVWR
jgi:hypothetical protein